MGNALILSMFIYCYASCLGDWENIKMTYKKLTLTKQNKRGR